MSETAIRTIRIGTRINYSGDMANLPGRGAVTAVRVNGPGPFKTFRFTGGAGLEPVDTGTVYDVTLDDGREIRGIYDIPAPRGRGCGDRFTLDLDNPDPLDADGLARLAAGVVVRRAMVAAADAARATDFAARMVKAKAAGVALGLVPAADYKGRGRPAAVNLRRELKAAGIKARVTCDGSINVTLDAMTDDPIDDVLARAKAIACKYKAGSFDGMTDSYDYAPNPWGRVFGDVDYVFVSVDR